MKSAKLVTIIMATWIAILAVLCFGSWYQESFSVAFIAVTKVIGLYIGCFAAIAVYRKSRAGDPNRRNWLLLGIAFLLYAMGQSVLCYHQAILFEVSPFPSPADLFFVVYTPPAVIALFLFCRNARRSGLSLGTRLVFWWPALLVLGLSLIALSLLLSPIIDSGGSKPELLLNIYYPIASLIVLALCAVIIRFGLKFRGGRVFWIWLTIALGYLLILSADIVFAYLSTLKTSNFEAAMDFLYATGYLLIPRGILYQRDVLSS